MRCRGVGGGPVDSTTRTGPALAPEGIAEGAATRLVSVFQPQV